ncbi:phage protein Gp27 family protein [uncultured Sphaerochaeta sp.]|uniref:phage protein Gp27 family protein n=1 Tax=uncultured Sphaerochaeta sp. TaxID=886478 RepID=UPI002A0A75F2|nr:phage protein Gp27 family protein [uncultured Sphaerochaeta sp.]
MGRKSKAEQLGLIEEIVRLHDEQHMTNQEIADHLQQKGFDIGREAVRNCYTNAERKAEKYKLAAESARSIVSAVKGTNVELAEAANSMVANMFYDRILQMQELDFASTTDFFKSMAPVMNNQVKLAQFRLSFEHGVEKTKAAVYDALAKELGQGNPELLEGLKKAIAGLKVKEK